MKKPTYSNDCLNNHRKQEVEPYIHRHYEVLQLYTTKNYTRDNVMTRMLNTLIGELKSNLFLPRFLVVVPDVEFLAMMNYTGFGISAMLGRCLHWLMKQIDRVIDTRREALAHRKPGAVFTSEPYVMWIKMLETPGHDKYAMVRSKFNVILEQAMEQSKYSHVLHSSDRDEIQRHLFNMNGNITHDGRIAYWNFISCQIQKFDLQYTSKPDYQLQHPFPFGMVSRRPLPPPLGGGPRHGYQDQRRY